MATLQKIRSKGPLVVIVVGVALFAFLAGDAWRVFQPHQSNEVGEINGNSLSAPDYQAILEEFKNYNSNPNVTEDNLNDGAWMDYLTYSLLSEEADKLGLEVTNAEFESILNEGTHPLLARTPFSNPQTGRFDKDALMKFLADYAVMSKGQMSAQYDEIYQYWLFLSDKIKQDCLERKYVSLITSSLMANDVDAKAAFDARVNQSDISLAAIPYNTIADSTVSVSDAEVMKAYEARKSEFQSFFPVDTRDIHFIDVNVTASAEDKAELEKELKEYADQLAVKEGDYTNFIRSTGSEFLYKDIFVNKDVLPSDVVSRMEEAKDAVSGPYYNMSDTTLNVFRVLDKAEMPNTVEFRMIVVNNADMTKATSVSDSIYNALKGGADFATVAKNYGQTGETSTLNAKEYEAYLNRLNSNDLHFYTQVMNCKLNEFQQISMGQARAVMQVTARNDMQEKYKVAVIKRKVMFSEDTFNKAYNQFSQFVAGNSTIKDLLANAEENGYKVLEQKELRSNAHAVANVSGSKELLRWVFAADKGEISDLYVCGTNKDHIMVVTVDAINENGYIPFSKVADRLRYELVNDKKAEKIMADMKNAGATSIAQYAGMKGAVNDTVKHVSFSSPASVSVLYYSNEPVVSAYGSVAEMNALSAPLKGNAGVMVLQKVADNKLNETFDAAAENEKLSTTYGQYFRSSYYGGNPFLQTLLDDLYKKAEVKDNRYLFF